MQTDIEIRKDTATEEQVKKFLDLLSLTVPFMVPRMSDMMYLAWYPTLSPYSWQELNWYLTYAAENLTQFPPLSAIKKILTDRRNGFLNVDPVTALMNGCKNKTSVTEPINHLALKFGGWTVIGQWPVDQWEFKRKAINEVWETVKRAYRVDVVKVNPNGHEIQKQEEAPFKPLAPEDLEKVPKIFAEIKKQLADSKSLRC
jgi:hypothetical protein